MGSKIDPITGQLIAVGVTEQELTAQLKQQRGEIETSLGQELQAAVQRVEGTASVATTAGVTLPAGSTGPVAVSLADPEFLGTDSRIKGLLGTVYGVLARDAAGSYSFTSEQSYTGSVALGAGTIFAAAHLPNTLNPLRVGDAELEDDNSYADAGYTYVMLDAADRVAWGVKADGSIVINKVGSLTGAFTGIFTGNLTGDVNANRISVNKLIAPGGTIDMDSADTQLLNILEGGAYTSDSAFSEFYSHVVLDSADRIAYGVAHDGAFDINGAVQIKKEGDVYAAAELDEQGRISRAIKNTGVQYIPRLEVDVLNAKNLTSSSAYADFSVDATAGDYLIRAISPTGNDANDGSTSSPWQTFTKLKTWIAGLPNPSKVKILIKAGSYSETVASPLYFQTSGLYSEVYFEEGVSITMVQVGTTTLSNAVGADRGEHRFYLNGAAITLSKESDYPTISDNGVGVHGGKVYVYGSTKTGTRASFSGFIDGTSNHNSGYMELDGCEFSNSSKGAYVHVNTSVSKHYDCVFEGLASSVFQIGEVEGTAFADFTECEFLPDPAATTAQVATIRNGTVDRCQIGTTTQSVQLQCTNVKVQDSYLNVVQNREHGNTTYLRCFGKYTNRNTSGNANEARMLSCVFAGPGSFAPASRFFQSGVNFGKFFIFNSILTGYDQVIDVGGNAGRIALVNDWALNGLCLFNNTVDFDSGITDPSILVTSDPLIGSADTVSQQDYEIGPGSPCRYTGVNNSNIGLPQETP